MTDPGQELPFPVDAIEPAPVRPVPRFGPIRVWHLALLVFFVAVAIANIQDQRRTEPALIAIASGGFCVYGLLGWAGWRFARRLGARVGPVAVLAIYLGGMSALFLAATVLYLLIERVYLDGGF